MTLGRPPPLPERMSFGYPSRQNQSGRIPIEVDSGLRHGEERFDVEIHANTPFRSRCIAENVAWHGCLRLRCGRRAGDEEHSGGCRSARHSGAGREWSRLDQRRRLSGSASRYRARPRQARSCPPVPRQPGWPRAGDANDRQRQGSGPQTVGRRADAGLERGGTQRPARPAILRSGEMLSGAFPDSCSIRSSRCISSRRRNRCG